MPTAESKPKIKIKDVEGSAFQILNRCQTAAKRADWSQDDLQKFLNEARKYDYQNLMEIVKIHFDVVV